MTLFASNSYPKVAIIIINWNGKDDTIECLKSIRNLNYGNYQVIVVDNCSSDGSQKILADNFPEIHLIENATNLGFGGGFNVGIRESIKMGADYVLCLNNDLVVDRDMLKELVKVGSISSKIAALSSMEYRYTEPERINCAGGNNIGLLLGKIVGRGQLDKGQFSKLSTTCLLSGPAMMIKTKVLLDVGLFDEDYFYGPEDKDIALRILEQGYYIILVPQAKIWHKIRGSTLGNISPLTTYFSVRNFLLYAKKHASLSAYVLFSVYFWLFFIPFRLFSFLILRRRQHAFATLKGLLWHINRNLLPSDNKMVELLRNLK